MYLKRLSDKIWATKNARFAAYKRMKRNRVSSTASVALLSASVIGINMLAFLDLSECWKNWITIITVLLSTFALVMSLLITLLRYESRENNYHQCGIDLDNLNQKIQIRIEELVPAGACPNDIVSPNLDNQSFLDEYIMILKKYNLDHTEFDYRYGMWFASNNKKYDWKSFCLWFRWYIWDVNMLYWLIAILPIVTVVGAFVHNDC